MTRTLRLVLALLVLTPALAGCQQPKEELKAAAPTTETGTHGPQRIPMAARPPASATAP